MMGSLREWICHKLKVKDGTTIFGCLRERFCQKFFNIHDRSNELQEVTPTEVRRASHDLSNATMKAEHSMREVRASADALTALVLRMQYSNSVRHK